jgi:hypothetical protein
VGLGLLAAILAYCVVKLVILAALLVPTGFLTRNVVIGAVGVVIGLAVLVIAVRRRSRRDGTCHLPSPDTDQQWPCQRTAPRPEAERDD